MSIDKLQKMIRKQKNPTVIDFSVCQEQIPPHLLSQEGSFLKAYCRFCKELLAGMKEIVPAARFSFGFFALFGADGTNCLFEVLNFAHRQGYYVLLDMPESLSASQAYLAAAQLKEWPCDGVVMTAYTGSDYVRTYAEQLCRNGKSLFVILRTANKSASELQDLVTGSRLVHIAAADIISRLGEQTVGQCGYCQIAGVGAANAAESLRMLRTKYSKMFLLVDGFDYSNANGKTCSYAFDKLGHGAAVCVGSGITAAWTDEVDQGENYVANAIEAAKRIQKNILRYITVL